MTARSWRSTPTSGAPTAPCSRQQRASRHATPAPTRRWRGPRCGSIPASSPRSTSRCGTSTSRRRDFGWACLDWALTTPLAAGLPALAAAELPALFAGLRANYGSDPDAPTAITDADRAWGLAPARDYARILAATWDRDYAPRFAARGIDAAPAWAAAASR